jgi:hypothetical protein
MQLPPLGKEPPTWARITSFFHPRRCSPQIWLILSAFMAFNILVVYAWRNLMGAWSSPASNKIYDPHGINYIVDESNEPGSHNGPPLRIAITESPGTHDEVVSALLHSFGGIDNSEINLYLTNQRYGIGDVIKDFTLASEKVSLYKWDEFKTHAINNPPHIIVCTTGEWELAGKRSQGSYEAFEKLLHDGDTYLFTTIHHANEWDKGKNVDGMKRWVDKGRADFLTLSEHTGNFLRNVTSEHWDIDYEVTTRTFPPVFPVAHSTELDPNEIGLAMQGDYSSKRRDYGAIFDQLDAAMSKAKKETAEGEDPKNVVLHLIGHGKHPEVPEKVKDNVHFDESLRYPDFYSLMSRQFAVLPAFATDHYLDRKASSSVPASIIAGVPLVASDALLNAYTYLPREAVWLAVEGESDMDVVLRVLSDSTGFVERRRIVKETALNIMAENRRHVRSWVSEGRSKLKKDKKHQDHSQNSDESENSEKSEGSKDSEK